MTRKRVYVAFDFDDVAAKAELVRQSALPECPFEFYDGSIEKPVSKGWPSVARTRIMGCDLVVVLCGM